MKKIIITIVTLSVFSLLNFTANAQTVKLGHVNISELLKVMPEYKKAEIDLQGFAKQLENAMAQMQQDYQQKVAKYYEEEAGMIPAIKETRQNEIVDLEKRIQTLQSKSESQLVDKQVQLLKPIEDKVTTAIKSFAQQESYTYIFDASPGQTLLYAPESNDVTGKIKAKLGL